MRRLCSVFFALSTLAGLTVFTPSAGQAELTMVRRLQRRQSGRRPQLRLRHARTVPGDNCRHGRICEPNLFYTGPAERPVKRARKRHND